MKRIAVVMVGLVALLSGCNSNTTIANEEAVNETVESSTNLDAEENQVENQFIWPEENGELGEVFGSYDGHDGIDISSGEGTDVLASADGIVLDNGFDELGEGNYITIDHGNGYQTVYTHLQEVPNLKIGDEVKQGEVIAKEGSTGNVTESLVHFEIIKDGENTDPQTVLPEAL